MAHSRKRRRQRKWRFQQLEPRLLLAVDGINLAPVLADPGAQAMSVGTESISVTLSATDPNPDDVLIFSAIPRSAEYYLDRSLGLDFQDDFFLNASKQLNEKWLVAENEDWYFITPDGTLSRWLGGGLTNGESVAALTPEIYADPALLYDADPGYAPASIAVDGATLTITPDVGFTGFFAIDVTVSDDCLEDTRQVIVTVNGNRAPTLVDPGPQSIKETEPSLEVDLSATDIDGDELTFSAVGHSTAYYFDQTIGLSSPGDYFLNFGGRNEKWLIADDASWYYLTPEGHLWHWQQGALEDDPIIAELSSAIYEDPSLLHDAQPDQPPPAAVTVLENVLTISPVDDFSGIFAITITASDGELTDSKRIAVTVSENQAPVLSPLDDHTVFTDQSRINIGLSAIDDDNDQLTFTAILHSSEYYLDQTVGFAPTEEFFTNFNGLGEKWIVAADESWYYITPDGRFWKWRGGAVANADLVATFDPATYADPALLFDAAPNVTPDNFGAKSTIANTTLTITITAGFVGSFWADVQVSDGALTDTKTVKITVAEIMNDPPVLVNPGNFTVLTSIDTLEIPLSASDPDGDQLTFTAVAHRTEYYLDQVLGLEFAGDLFFNFSGQLNEKWIAGANDRWYFLTPDGILWESVNGGTQSAIEVSVLSVATYTNPQRLYNAQPGGGPGRATVNGSTLTVDPNANFVGLLGVEIIVSDGREVDSALILVEVEPFGIIEIDEAPPDKSYDSLAERWFEWLVGDTVAPSSFPFDFPLTDTNGVDANDNQVDTDVFFVGGIFGATADRSFSVPAGRNLFVALSASFWTNLPGADPALGVIATKQSIDAVNSLSLVVNNTEIPSATLFAQRASATDFAATFATGNWFDFATGGLFPAGTTSGHSVDGYWALFPPLAAGNHTIRFSSAASGTFVAEGGFSAEEIAGSANLNIAFSQDITLHISAFVPAGRIPAFSQRLQVEDRTEFTLLPHPHTVIEVPTSFAMSASRPRAEHNVDVIVTQRAQGPRRNRLECDSFGQTSLQIGHDLCTDQFAVQKSLGAAPPTSHSIL